MKILFQGSLGAYSHLAALEVYPEAEIIPCKTFDECFSKANEDDKIKIIIPESNRITGNIGEEYLIFKYRLNIYAEHFHPVQHHLLGLPGTKTKEIKHVYSHAQALSQSNKFIKKNNFIENNTKQKVPDETIILLKVQRDEMVKQLIQFPDLYYTKSHFPLEVSQRAFDQLWRMCESYELW